MAERTVVGVDFSGAIGGVPWVTTAVLQGNYLILEKGEEIPREDLKKRLRKLPSSAVAAMDFPFGVPRKFALELESSASAMPHLWRMAKSIEYKDFLEFRNSFVNRFGEIPRSTDKGLAGPLSPLKTGGPNMLPMTFRGMELLHDLQNAGCCVQPLSDENCKGSTFIETMPGAVLRLYKLPHQKYKGRKNDLESRKIRKEILKGLENKSPLPLQISEYLREQCIDYHDCLDSLIAAIVAAIWQQNPKNLRQPNSDQIADAQLEGWIYTPKQ